MSKVNHLRNIYHIILFSCVYQRAFLKNCKPAPLIFSYEIWNMQQRNTEHRRNSGTPRDSGGTTERYPEHQRNTPEYQPNTNVTPVEHPGTTEPYNTKNNCSIFKRKIKTFNLWLKHSFWLI